MFSRANTATLGLLVVLLQGGLANADPRGEPTARWSPAKAQRWVKENGWPVGANYIPSTAINQTEMWAKETYDRPTIQRELKAAADLGFNTMRVFLSDLVWEQDAEGMYQRMDDFLSVAQEHGLKIMFVPLDSVWDPEPKAGKQPAPRPGVHNSGWHQVPHTRILRDPALFDAKMKPYVQGVLARFKNDPRVHSWDLWNEPDNPNSASYGDRDVPDKGKVVEPLLQKVFDWAKEIDPAAPLTSGIWAGDDWSKTGLRGWEKVQVGNSDIITFHNYENLAGLKRRVRLLRRYGRPMIVTEYMARTLGSTFRATLPFFERNGVGALNWGFAGKQADGSPAKSGTIFAWSTWQQPELGEPAPWFHDILTVDAAGNPVAYDAEEVRFIKKITARNKAKRDRIVKLSPAHRAQQKLRANRAIGKPTPRQGARPRAVLRTGGRR